MLCICPLTVVWCVVVLFTSPHLHRRLCLAASAWYISFHVVIYLGDAPDPTQSYQILAATTIATYVMIYTVDRITT